MPGGRSPESTDHAYGGAPPDANPNSDCVTATPTVTSFNVGPVTASGVVALLATCSENTLETTPFGPVAVTVNKLFRVFVGVPDSTPAELMDRLAPGLPTHVQGDPQSGAEKVAEYGTPTVPP